MSFTCWSTCNFIHFKIYYYIMMAILLKICLLRQSLFCIICDMINYVIISSEVLSLGKRIQGEWTTFFDSLFLRGCFPVVRGAMYRKLVAPLTSHVYTRASTDVGPCTDWKTSKPRRDERAPYSYLVPTLYLLKSARLLDGGPGLMVSGVGSWRWVPGRCLSL